MKLSPAAVEDIRARMRDAPRGAKSAVAAELGARYGVSIATVYRRAAVGGAARRRAKRRPEYRGWVETAVALAHRAPAPVPLDLAIESAIGAGHLPAEAAAMPAGTAHRIARELGLRPAARRTQRIHADYPMQAVQFDASTSAHLTVLGPAGDGDWRLRLHRSPIPRAARGYKNRPLGPDRLRLMVYGIWDACTGYRRARYVVARGESAADAVAALVEMLRETGDPERPLHGLPDDLWSDQGPAFSARASRELLGRLGIGLVTGEPYRKERMGGVERAWRTQWARFERSLFLAEEGADEVLLSRLNLRLEEYERREGRRTSRARVGGRTATRAQAWTALSNGRPADRPLRAMPADAMRTLHREGERRIDRNGIVRWEGEEWECREWHSRRVLVRQRLAGDADALTLVDPRTGERSQARRYGARRYGEVRAIPATALDRLLDAAAERGAAGSDPFAARAPAPAGVVPLRPRAPAPAALPDPLDAGRYESLADAMAAFGELYPWPLGPADRAAVRAAIEAAGFEREAVAELAGRLLREAAGA